MTEESPWDALKACVSRVSRALPAGSLRGRFARGTFWAMVASIVTQALGMVATVITGRVLGTEGFGELGMVRDTMGMVGVLAGLGLGMTAVKHVAEFRKTDPGRAGRVIGLCLWVAVLGGALVSLVLWAASPLLARGLMNRPELADELRIGCLLLFVESVIGAQNGVLAGLEAFRTLVKVNLVRGLVSLPLVVTGVHLYGVPGVLFGYIGGAVGGWVMSLACLRAETSRRGIPISLRNMRDAFPVLWKFALPALLGSSVVTLTSWLAQVILVNTRDGYSRFGLYGAARRWEQPVLFLSVHLGTAVVPILSSLVPTASGEETGNSGLRPQQSFGPQAGRVMEAVFAALLVVVLPAVTLLASLSDWVMGLYGESFAGGASVLIAVLFVAGAKAIGNMSGMAITARGAMWSGFLINLTWAAVLLVLVVRWADRGALGFAHAFAASYALSTVYGLLLVGFKRFMTWRLVLSAFLATVLVAGFSFSMLWVESTWLRLGLVALATLIGVTNAVLARRRLQTVGVAEQPLPSMGPASGTGEDASCTF